MLGKLTPIEAQEWDGGFDVVVVDEDNEVIFRVKDMAIAQEIVDAQEEIKRLKECNALLADMANRKRLEKGIIEAIEMPKTQEEIDRIWDDPEYRIAPWWCRGCGRIFTGWALQDHPFYISSEDTGVYYWCRGCAELDRGITPKTWEFLASLHDK